MKIKKPLIIVSAITAMIALGATSQAQSVSGWGFNGYGNGGTGAWTMTEGSPGAFTIGGGTMDAAAGWAAAFPTVTLGVGEYIDLSGQFTVTGGGFGGSGPFRFGLFNDLGTIGTLSSGAWSGGSTSWTGYTLAPPTYGAAPGGNGEFGGHDASSYASTYSGYGFGTSSANASGIANDTYNFDLKLTQLSASSVQVDLSLVGQSSTPYSEVVSAVDNGGAATANTTYNAAGFYLAQNGTTATQLAFTGVQVMTGTAPVPEPASVALLGCGLLGLLLIRRAKMKTT